MAAQVPDVVGWPLDEALAALAARGVRWALRRTAFTVGLAPGGVWRVLALRPRGDRTTDVGVGPGDDADIEVVVAAFPAPVATVLDGGGSGAREGR